MSQAAANSFQATLSRFLLPILAATVGLQLLLVLLIVVGVIAPLGWRIPTSNIFSDYLVASVIANLFLPLFFILPIPLKHRRMLAIAWCIRCVVALGLSLYYESWYGLDAYSFFAASSEASLTELFHATGFGLGNENIIFLTKFFTFYLPDSSYHAAKIIFASMGQFAAYFFYRSLLIFNGGKENIIAFWFLACFPSGLFWSSILGKDPVVLLGLSVYAIGLASFTARRSAYGLIYAVLGLGLASSIRSWLFPLFLGPLLIVSPWLISRRRLRIILILMAIGFSVVAVPVLFQRFGITTSDDLISYLNRFSRAWARGGSSQELDRKSVV